MICIQHRQNTSSELAAIPKQFGVEIDIRNHGGELLVIHDPFSMEAERLEDWLAHFDHLFLIANVKEEGLEPKLLPMLKNAGVDDFFILDESIPYIRKYALEGVPQFAMRVSEFESAETAIALQAYLAGQGQRVEWIWLDCFTGVPRPLEEMARLRAAGFKLCQVSPELHHVPTPDVWESKIVDFRACLDGRTDFDMVCTKRPDLWLRSLAPSCLREAPQAPP